MRTGDYKALRVWYYLFLVYCSRGGKKEKNLTSKENMKCLSNSK